MSKVQETKRAGRWLTFWIMPWYGMLHHGHLRLLSRSLWLHGLRTPGEEIAFTERPKIHSHSQIFRYGWSLICLPHRPKFSDFFDLCLHWVSVVRGKNHNRLFHRTNKNWLRINESTKKSYLTSCCIGNNTLERNITNSIPERWEKCPLNPIVQKVAWKIELALNVFWGRGIKILPKCLL